MERIPFLVSRKLKYVFQISRTHSTTDFLERFSWEHFGFYRSECRLPIAVFKKINSEAFTKRYSIKKIFERKSQN